MIPRYSVAQARDRFAEIVHSLESQPRLEVTRRGRTVAVIISVEVYEQMQAAAAAAAAPDFWDNYQAFRVAHDLDGLNIGPATFEGVRDRSSGREAAW
jgi:prevent-host-death family protein